MKQPFGTNGGPEKDLFRQCQEMNYFLAFVADFFALAGRLLAAGLLVGLLALGLLAAFFALGFLVAFLPAVFLPFLAVRFAFFGRLAFLAFFALFGLRGRGGLLAAALSLNLPEAPTPEARTSTPSAVAFLRYRRMNGASLTMPIPRLLAEMYFLMAAKDEPRRSLRFAIAVRTMSATGG